MNRSRLLLYAAALVAAACQDRQSPTAAPSFLIQDATHNSGNPHFYWLPPMTRQPSFTGTFDGTLAPVVEISELGGVTGCSNRVVATFTTTTGPGSETVRVDLVNQLYIVNWSTKAFNLNTACTYRIRFLVAGLELGIADVDVVDNGAQLKRVDTDEFVALLDDGTLAIKARVELGAVTFAVTGDATACRPGRDCGEAVVTPVAGQDVTVLTTAQTAGLFIPAAALREQIIVLIESRTDRPCIPLSSLALPQFDDCYRYVVNPTASIERPSVRQATEGEINTSYSFGDGRDETLADNVIVGMCVEVGNLTPAQAARLDIFRFEPPAGPVNTIRDASAAFLPCDPNFGAPPPVGASGVLHQGWRLVMRGLHSLLGTRTAYASTSVIHLGLGGSTCCTSYFTWGVPGVLSPNSASQFYQSPGGTVVPSIVVRDSGGTPMAGAIVTFSVAAENGTITGTNPVTTGVDGIAQVSWQLPSVPGTYSLTADAPGAAESPLTFTATALFLSAILTDPTGDAGNGPDFVSAAATAANGGLRLIARFAPGTFSAATTLVDWAIDTDRNTATGFAGITSGHSDADKIGAEFFVEAHGSDFGSTVRIRRWNGTSLVDVPNSLVAFYPLNAIDVNMPLSLLGDDDGSLNFKATVVTELSPTSTTQIFDFISDLGADPGVLAFPLARYACSLEPTFHSINGDVSTFIRFVNQTAGPVTVYWLNYEGQRVLYTTVAAEQSYVQQTFITHPWIATDASGACLGIWLPAVTLDPALIGG